MHNTSHQQQYGSSSEKDIYLKGKDKIQWSSNASTSLSNNSGNKGDYTQQQDYLASSSSRPRASSGVCVRPQLHQLGSRIRSRSLLKASDEQSSSTHSVVDTSLGTPSNTASPKFGSTLLPRLAAAFGGSSSVTAGGAQSVQQEDYDNNVNTASPSFTFSSEPSSTTSGNMLTFSDATPSSSSSLSSNTNATPNSSLLFQDSTAFGTDGPSTTIKFASPKIVKNKNNSNSPIANIPFLPRRRTLSNLLNQISGSGNNKDKDKDIVNIGANKKESSSLASTSSISSSPSLRNKKSLTSLAQQSLQETRDCDSNTISPPQAWTSSSAINTPPAGPASKLYTNPFASAFSTLPEHPSSSNIHRLSSEFDTPLVRPASPRLKKQQSYLALNIPPTPGVSTPSLAYTDNGGRPLRGDDDDLILPSPIVEVVEEHHAGQQSFNDSSFSNATHEYGEPSHLSGIAAQPISSSTSFLASLNSTTPTLSTHRASHQKLSSLLPPILFLCVSFVVSLTIIFFMVSTIPLTIPHNVSEIKIQSVALRDYSRKGLTEGLHVSAVLSALFVFKQAFSVPGSILVNILFGSLYGTYAATLCACVFTGVGSVLAYYMARLCAPLVERFFPRALATTRSALLSGSASDLFSYLLLARLFPLLPYSALNIACGVLKVPVKPYFITLVLGSFPYNFVTTQLGDLLGNLANSAEAGNINAIWTWDLILKLAIASIVSAAPVIFKEQLKSIIGGEAADKQQTALSSMPVTGVTPEGLTQMEEEIYEETIPLAPISRSAAALAEEARYEPYGVFRYDKPAPILRRDRTDSSASEVFYAPDLSLGNSGSSSPLYSHKKKWSLSWSGLRRSLNLGGNNSSNRYANDIPSSTSDYSVMSPGSASSYTCSHSTARTSLDEETGDPLEEDYARQRISSELQRRSSGSSFHSFNSHYTCAPSSTHISKSHSRPASIDYSANAKHGRRTASIETASSSPSVAQHHQFGYPSAASSPTTPALRSSQEWDRF